MPDLLLHEPLRIAELDQVGDVGPSQRVEVQAWAQTQMMDSYNKFAKKA